MELNIDWNIVNEVIKIIISAGVGGIITYVTTFSKLKKEQRAIIIGKTMEDRRKALTEIKDIISELSEYERVDIVHPESLFKKPAVYHHVFENYETFNEFSKKINLLRKKYDQKIDGDVFLSLVMFDKYLFDYSKVINIGLKQEEGAVYTVGVAVWKEVNNWYKKFIWKIDKELNKPKYKYNKKYGIIYNKKLKKSMNKLKKTDLYKLFIVQMKLEDDKIGDKFKKIPVNNKK